MKVVFLNALILFIAIGAFASENKISLMEVASGFKQPTDIEFLPGSTDQFLVLEKEGTLKFNSLSKKSSSVVMKLDVETQSEMGLLGLAFHPQFKSNHKIYINYNPKRLKEGETRKTRISEWIIDENANWKAGHERILLEVEQPYGNHKGGQLVFGPDHFLYIGLGDGGSAGDPQGNGQNLKTLLGKMLRIEVDHPDKKRNLFYGIPKDNPFAGNSENRPEIFAYGLRNPWRFTFSPAGKLIVADVGQNKWEEIDIVERGKNYGWNIREGKHCYSPSSGCRTEGLVDPIYEYGHDEGICIIGGYFYRGSSIPFLKGHYLFADFGFGKIWSLDLKSHKAALLGRWPLQIDTFARDASGEVYVADYASGRLFRLESSKQQ